MQAAGRALAPVQTLQLLPLDQSAPSERIWLDETLAWLKGFPPGERTQRLRELGTNLCEDAAVRQRFQQLWKSAYAPRLFAEAALPEATSLLREVRVRMKRRFLPRVEDEMDLYAALQNADLHEEDAQWIKDLKEQDVEPWQKLLSNTTSDDLLVAIRLLSMRAAAIGLSPSVMSVMPHRYETESPFFALVDEVKSFVDTHGFEANSERLRNLILQCRLSAGQAHLSMEGRGVSADLVFRVDLAIAQLDRIDELLNVFERQCDGQAFAASLVRALAMENGFHSLLRNSVNRVARRVVAHTGKSGEHYIAGSRADWVAMGYGAMGAGGITAFTALFKYLFAGMALAPLWIGVAHSLNYTVSFVCMQFLGWKLASKMPAMTAAALCDALGNEDGMRSEVRLVAAITRTQTVVTVGNLMGAIPLALLLAFVIRWASGRPFLNEEAAMHGIASLHPLLSLTLPFAALTGCFLWISSLCAGWAANWMAVNRLPAAIAQSRKIRRLVGGGTAVRFAAAMKNHFSGVVGYVALGLMLGLLPFVSVFAGLPVEVRHITLASASLAYDVGSLDWPDKIAWVAIGWASVGLIGTGLLNFGVSFALGLWLAVRAQNLDTTGRRELVVALGKEFRRCPARFFWRHNAEVSVEKQ